MSRVRLRRQYLIVGSAQGDSEGEYALLPLCPDLSFVHGQSRTPVPTGYGLNCSTAPPRVILERSEGSRGGVNGNSEGECGDAYINTS